LTYTGSCGINASGSGIWRYRRSNNSEETIVEFTINQEVIMEIALAFGALVSVFVGLGALILFTPYDK